MRLPSRTAYLFALARLVLFWEAAWRAVLPLLCVIGLFTALALLELPALLPAWAHVLGLALFALLMAVAAWAGYKNWRTPEDGAALRWLENDSGLSHRPLGTLRDQLANSHDAGAAALWRAHRRRMQAQLRGLRVGLPRPGLPAADPWGLRAVVFLLLAMGLFVGGAAAPQRLGRALQPDFSADAGDVAELEAWLNPPDYTGLPPVKLDPKSTDALRVPQGSTLMARVFGGGETPRLLIDGAATPFLKIDERNFELSQLIEAGQRLSVVSAEQSIADWPLAIIVDQIPTVESDVEPSVTVRQAVRLSYKAADDYGLAAVWAELRRADADDGTDVKKPGDATGKADPAAAENGGEAADETVLKLDLPISPPGAREARDNGYFDLTPHPWAGLNVTLRYLAKDDRGQTGWSEVIAFQLPERQFRHPVARAVVEQRRDLSRLPERRFLVAMALFAIASGPETYDNDQIAYLALWTAARRLQLSRGEPAAEVMELLWQVALRIEDGGMSLAERELRAAQDALMAALAEGAEQAEIERLMDELQRAMEKYLQALAEQAQRDRQAQGPQATDPNARSVDAMDLQKMMDRIRELSRLGATDAAREMLRKLQEMLENLEAQRATAQQQGDGPGEKAMRRLGELLRKQQELMDKTYQQTPRRRRMPWEKRDGENGEQNSGGGQGSSQNGPMTSGKREAMRGLANRQGGLRQRLGDVMRQLGAGMGKIPNAMGGVDQAMREAQRALRSGRGGQALSSQRQAIDGLANSFRELAEEMMKNAQDDGLGQFSESQEDPAGRPFQGGGMDTSRVMVPDDSELARARHILDELRRRAGERARARLERDYIERLLERF
ncbi:MAG: TIGR02302 family protein [Alphaproteobacteria bacterium]|nr:TIGR02302 family protein [Alphaproteobacteria bacterium]